MAEISSQYCLKGYYISECREKRGSARLLRFISNRMDIQQMFILREISNSRQLIYKAII